MLISVDSGKSLEQIAEDLPKACADHCFGVLGTHDLKQKMRERRIEHRDYIGRHGQDMPEVREWKWPS